jgi:integrase
VIDEQWRQHETLKAAGNLSPYVFHRRGKRIKNFRGAWKAACQAVGVAGRIPHDFRRTAVRNLVRSGVPDTVAMKITGHLTRSVFDRYDISSEADIREGLGRLPETTGTKRGDNRGYANSETAKQSA